MPKEDAAVPDIEQDVRYLVLAYGIVGGLAASLAFVAWLSSRPCRLLPIQRARRSHWDGGQVLFAFLVMMFVPPIVEGGLLGRGFFHLIYGQEPSPNRQHLWANLIAVPFIIAMILIPLYLLRRARPADFGITSARVLPNMTLGILAWFPLTLATLAMHLLVLQFTEGRDHQITDLVKDGIWDWEWGLIGLEALAAAPFLEELLFRGVLQGWLARCSRLGHIVVITATLFVAGMPYVLPAPEKGPDPALKTEPDPGPLIFALCLVPGYLWLVVRRGPTDLLTSGRLAVVSSPESLRAGPPPSPFWEAIQASHNGPGDPPVTVGPGKRFPMPAVYGSSMLWAVFHSSVWPSPLALFLLGLGLGWLAYRTQSLVSSLILHMLFNAVAFLVLVLQVS
jgi:membrane protease YdiL (CAAX protease family)